MSAFAGNVALFIDSKCTLGEAILWDERRRALMWSDIACATLWIHLAHDSASRSVALPDRLGALALCDSGKLLLGLAKGLFLADLDLATDLRLRLTMLVPVEADLASTRLNDGRTDRFGNFVFGTLNEHPERAPIGSVYQYSNKHGLRRLALGGVAIPNSICFSLDGLTMYYCDSLERRIMHCRYDAESAGVSDARALVDFRADQGFPDGSVIDADGCLWNAEWGAGIVRRYTSAGSIEREIAMPVKNPTCVAFGGPDLGDLYITSARQEMTPAELARAPHAGGVYRASFRDVRGWPEKTFNDS